MFQNFIKKLIIYLCYCIRDCRVHASCPFSVEDGALNCHYRLNCGSILHTNEQDCTIHGSHYTKQINLLIPANTKSKVRKKKPPKKKKQKNKKTNLQGRIGLILYLNSKQEIAKNKNKNKNSSIVLVLFGFVNNKMNEQ